MTLVRAECGQGLKISLGVVAWPSKAYPGELGSWSWFASSFAPELVAGGLEVMGSIAGSWLEGQWWWTFE